MKKNGFLMFTGISRSATHEGFYHFGHLTDEDFKYFHFLFTGTCTVQVVAAFFLQVQVLVRYNAHQ
jgi:hypothetical protein